MKNIRNQPDQIISEMLQGFYYEHQDRIKYNKKDKIIYRKNLNQVALISGGGSGHEPAHFGYVGAGMLSASVNGEIFIPPTVEQILSAIRLSDTGYGVLLIIKNFKADVDNFLAAQGLAEAEGHQIQHVIVNDDVSIEDDQSYNKRKRGVAGTVFVHKILGAAAAQAHSLSILKSLGDAVIAELRTLGVALTHALPPTKSAPSFTLNEDEVYFGIGIHGEKGYRKESFSSSEQLAIELVNKLKSLYKWKRGDEFAVLINGLGATPLMEQYIFTNDIRRLLQLEHLNVTFVKVGSHLTSYDMKGISLSMLKIQEAEWIRYLKADTDAPKW